MGVCPAGPKRLMPVLRPSYKARSRQFDPLLCQPARAGLQQPIDVATPTMAANRRSPFMACPYCLLWRSMLRGGHVRPKIGARQNKIPFFLPDDGSADSELDPTCRTHFALVMCNLYSITRSQEAIRRLFRIGRDLTGNMPPLPGSPTPWLRWSASRLMASASCL
jgi:hypothetical protein